MAGQKCNAVQFHPTRATWEYVLKLPPARRKQTVYHLTHCTRSTHALLNMLIILIIIMMIAGRSSLETHMHTHKPKSDVEEETKQRSTGKERRGERIATGNRRRGVNDNVEYDWGRFMGFLHRLLHGATDFSCTHTVLWLMTFTVTQSAVSPWLASNKTPWVERIRSFTLCRCVCVCVSTNTHTHLLYQH